MCGLFAIRGEKVMSEFSDLGRDLCKRTLVNLEFIDNAKRKGEEVYETTQLFNSLLGIVVNADELLNTKGIFNREKIILIKDEWRIPVNTYENGKQDKNLKDFIAHLRNCTAHVNVNFEKDDSAEIKYVHFEATRSKVSYDFEVEDLRIFLKKLCEFVLEH